MRDLVGGKPSDAILLEALSSTRAVVVANETALQRHSARVALATTVQLAARSGAIVYLEAPNAGLDQPLPPLGGGRLLDSLVALGGGLLPGQRIRIGVPDAADVVILLGETAWRQGPELVFRLNADDTEGFIVRTSHGAPWRAGEFPLGALAAAGLAAAEVFKASMRKLRQYALNPAIFDEQLSPVSAARLPVRCGLAVAEPDLGAFDVVSGGAICQGLLFCLAQIPGARGSARVIEPERSDASNMNRYMLLLDRELGRSKVESLSGLALGGLRVEPLPHRFDERSLPRLLPLRDRVLVGVDDIPSRWFIQAQWPSWLGIGATSHFGAMSSWHASGAACAQCLHPRDEAIEGPLPTAAFVSFLAGLSLAARLLDVVRGGGTDVAGQQEWLDTLRLDRAVWRTPVAMRQACPLNCGARARYAA
jgi:hypothetical protein